MARTVKQSKTLTAGHPVKAAYLSKAAGREWDRLMGELAESNIEVTTAHRSFVELASTIAADLEEARAAVDKDGAYIVGKAGLVAHPASKRLDALRRDQIKVLTMLGLRTAVATDGAEKERTLDDALNG